MVQVALETMLHLSLCLNTLWLMIDKHETFRLEKEYL